MDEYAYGFVTENSHYGVTHNPHDLGRVAGGGIGWRCRRSCSRISAVDAGYRYQWVNSRSGFILRHFWPKTDLWTPLTRWSISICR
jgi:hypothetical protein